MSFKRGPAPNWQDIPGARWFKADLHVHTMDDHPGGRVALPGDPTDPDVVREYARRFLKAAVETGVRVIGLTPHAPRAAAGRESSAVWAIIDEWNEGEYQGTPFREQVYAVFPGFEPNIDDGSRGVHLLFLFDPEIGRDRYLSLYHAVMDGRVAWRHSALQPTSRNAQEVFGALAERQSESRMSGPEWDFIALAPHFQGDHGVLREIRSQVLARFPCDRLCGYELGDDKLPSDFDERGKPGNFLLPFMAAHRQAFFHASDAYAMEDIGRRHTWMKLGTPRVEALRQAFIASESRMRLGFQRTEDGLREIDDPPDVTRHQRPWMKQARVAGAGSFFGAGQAKGANFRFSPDLTCIIGGSMTGKSTLLDGLRVTTGARLPEDESLLRQVRVRGGDIFAGGSPEVTLDCPGADPTASLLERWPAVFFAQNELQRLSQETSAVEVILAKLVPAETAGIEERSARLVALDGELPCMAKQLAELDDDLADAEQARDRAMTARNELDALAEVGVERLHTAARDRQRWIDTHRDAMAVHAELRKTAEAMRAIAMPGLEDTVETPAVPAGDLKGRLTGLIEQVDVVGRELDNWIQDAGRVSKTLSDRENEVRVAVDRALAARGMDAARLREIRELNRQASLLSSYEANLKQTHGRVASSQAAFVHALEERVALVERQRESFGRVMFEVGRMFEGRIRVRRVDGGDHAPLEKFLVSLKQRGITRWWNELPDEEKPSVEDLACSVSPVAAAGSGLDDLGMSNAVKTTFRESLTRSRARELEALRCPDRFLLELRLDDGNYRRLDELSGGQRVSVLLSLLLETEDDRPLVIDQPEDELDNRFLFETVLPALRRFKGRRQIIVATHNANIVVNGDADLVIQLEATANRGEVEVAGPIEDPAVRAAIVRTVDGGEEAFRLRRRKYGF